MVERPYLVVTGAANGIGRSLALLALEQGFGVVAVDLDEAALSDLVSKSEQIKPICGSVSDPETSRLVSESLLASGAACKGLVNNAACMDRGTLEQVSPVSFHRLFDVNCLGTLLMTQALTPLLSQSGGAVVNMGSVNAHGGESHLLMYSMTKAALACMTRNLAPTLGRLGVRICQVNLGWTLTDAEIRRKIDEGWPEDWYDTLDRSRSPFGRLFTPREVAEFVMFLLSPTCSLLNGSVIDFAQNAVGMGSQP